MRTVLVLVVAALVLAAPARGAEPANGNVVLDLDGALAKGEERHDLELEFPVRGGEWPQAGWGYAVTYNRGHTEAQVIKNDLEDGVRTLVVKVRHGADRWVKGGTGRYTIILRRAGEGFEGTYEGSFTAGAVEPMKVPRLGVPKPTARDLPTNLPPGLRKAILGAGGKEEKEDEAEAEGGGETAAVSGKVAGRILDPWPGEVENFVPPEPGEHPRLIFRKADLAKLKARAKTPAGQAILARMMQVLDVPGPSQGDKFISWPAVGYGFAYLMTGEAKYADQARDLIERTSLRGSGGGQDIHHAPRALGFALAFDLVHDALDEGFRLRCIDDLQRRTMELATGTAHGKGMGGFNPNVWSNHNGIRAGAMGIAALAIQGEKNSEGRLLNEAAYVAEIAGREIRDYIRYGLGGGAYGMEGTFYRGMTMRRGFLQILHAYPNAAGKIIDARTLGDWIAAGYLIEAPPGRRFAHASESVDGEKLSGLVWSMGLVTVPEDMMPGVKWVLDRTAGMQGNRTFGVSMGFYAPFALVSYPFDVEAKPPSESLRWVSPDPLVGHYVFRPTWGTEDDILLVTNLKSRTRGGCHYERSGVLSNLELWGLGRKWIDGQYLVRLAQISFKNELQGPVVTQERRPLERVRILDMDLFQAYLHQIDKKKGAGEGMTGERVDLTHWGGPMLDQGVRGTRSMAVDASGASGCPLLVALAEHVHDKAGKGLASAWHLPLTKDAGPIAVDGNRYTVGDPDGPRLAGVLAAGGPLHEKTVAAEGQGRYVTVFVLAEAGKPVPEMKVEGDGTVTVGKRTVRVVDDKLVLE